MQKIEKKLLATYAYEDFFIEIFDFNGEYEAWLQHKDYGVKDLIFGAPKTKQTLEEYVADVENVLDEYIEKYEESYY